MKQRLGIIGCGQLGQMLGQAARRLGIEVCFLSLDEAPVVHGLGRLFEVADIEDFLRACDRVTVEREAIADAVLLRAEALGKLRPSFSALEELRNRNTQKALLDRLNIPTADWCYVETPDRLVDCVQSLSAETLRCKRVLGGYDGGGQWRIEKAAGAWNIPAEGFPLIAEAELPVEREVSLLIARDKSGEKVIYPIAENEMRNGILTWSFIPADIDAMLVQEIQTYGERLVDAIDYVGVLAIEFFISRSRLVVNEIAPRVHNTGHWSLNAGEADQFEQHVRAVMGLPLAQPQVECAAAMCNLLGNNLPKTLPSAPVRMYLQSYGKQLRPGRKTGHLTLIGPDMASVRAAAEEIGLFR